MICHNCIHEDLCEKRSYLSDKETECSQFKDKDLCIELPCKIGEILYGITMRADTKKRYIVRATLTYRNCYEYVKLYKEGRVFKRFEDAEKEIKRLNELDV